MGIAQKDEVFEETTPEHAQVLDYMNSAAWEARLAEARARRERVLAAREAARGTDQFEFKAAPADLPRPFGPDSGFGDPPDLAPEPQMEPPEAEPEPDAAPRPDAVTADVQAPRARFRMPGLVDGVFLTTVIATLALAVVFHDPGSDEPFAESAPPADAITQADEPPATPERDGRPAPAERAASLADSIDELGPDYDVRVIAMPGAAAPDGATYATRSTRFAMQAPMVSFFHSEDEAAATRLSERIDAEVLDLTGLRPSPPAGTIDVHLAEG